MSITRGGPTRRKRFTWLFDVGSNELVITNENQYEHLFSLGEIQSILEMIQDKFGDDYFPLGNNVEYLGSGTEQMGLGRIILELDKDGHDVRHAQGASYLGVVLEEVGYFEWNGLHHGIKWKLRHKDFSLYTIVRSLNSKRL